MERLIRLAPLAALALVLVGCGSGDEPVKAPTASQEQQLNQSKAAWTQDKVDAFNKAHADARSGADEQSNSAIVGKK